MIIRKIPAVAFAVALLIGGASCSSAPDPNVVCGLPQVEVAAKLGESVGAAEVENNPYRFGADECVYRENPPESFSDLTFYSLPVDSRQASLDYLRTFGTYEDPDPGDLRPEWGSSVAIFRSADALHAGWGAYFTAKGHAWKVILTTGAFVTDSDYQSLIDLDLQKLGLIVDAMRQGQ